MYHSISCFDSFENDECKTAFRTQGFKTIYLDKLKKKLFDAQKEINELKLKNQNLAQENAILLYERDLNTEKLMKLTIDLEEMESKFDELNFLLNKVGRLLRLKNLRHFY